MKFRSSSCPPVLEQKTHSGISDYEPQFDQDWRGGKAQYIRNVPISRPHRLNGGLDGLPILTLIMFTESRHVAVNLGEQAVQLGGKDYEDVIEQPCRWRERPAKYDGPKAAAERYAEHLSTAILQEVFDSQEDDQRDFAATA